MSPHGPFLRSPLLTEVLEMMRTSFSYPKEFFKQMTVMDISQVLLQTWVV